ncbi:MAG: SUMF1/EgtB/PvdO family nonheme iron enzyme [Planctomycetes bacterium]|nr:SUMF1/EgtB/PvdO family nonheme iron enzyme [Planctomycetota bacterium]
MEQTIALPLEILRELEALRDRVGPGPACVAGVDALIAAHPQHAPALRAWLLRTSGEAGSASLPAFGRYRPISLLGTGGFGEVHLAEQLEPVRRQVALKVLKLGMDSASILRRFAREQSSLARMNHDAVAKILDAGTTPSGQPFFAMELVDGAPITVHCDRVHMPLRERVELFVEVCAGVQHAHQKGVVHRDLKPGNVLVARQGERAQPKLIDFGIARALAGDDDTSDPTLTEAGAVLGTPSYMAPEQLRGDLHSIDTRTDVYALGAILFELLTGLRPLAGELGEPAAAFVARQRLAAIDVPRPSVAMLRDPSTLAVRAELRATSPAGAARALRADLDWIVLRAMAKEPERRYASVAELAGDLERYLRGEAVLAGPPGFGYRLRKFVQRRRGQAIAIAAVASALLVGGVATFVQYLRAEGEAQKNLQLASIAEQERDRADAKVDEFEMLAAVVEHERVRARADELGPAWPERIPVYEAWLRDDWEVLRKVWPRLEGTVAATRSRALPWSDAERAVDRSMHPRYAEWLGVSQQLAAVERAQPREPDALVPLLPTLPEAIRGSDPATMLKYCHRRVSPKWAERTVAGEEALGLIAAYTAQAALPATAEPVVRAAVAEELAWAELANGNHVAARRHLEKARAEVAGDAAALKDREAVAREFEAAVAALPALCSDLRKRLAVLEPLVAERLTFTFPPDEAAARFLHDALSKLLRDRDRLATTAARVERDLGWARALATPNWRHPQARHGVDDVRRGLASSTHPTLQALAPTFEIPVGLVPIGPNPATGLWEFYDLRSAWAGQGDPAALPLPTHGPDGSIALDETMGIVFVLVPGGTFVMGAQNTRPNDPNHEVGAREGEDAHHVTLGSFLIARHEVTQAQWERLWNGDESLLRPSQYRPGADDRRRGAVTALHPVEQVNWSMANRLATDHGLCLPTEAQWEYACRAGTNTPYWCGPRVEDLGPVANLLDRTAESSVSTWGKGGPFTDGAVLHWPVGSGRANAFGLHDVHGNVFEWCRERYIGYEFPTDLRTGERSGVLTSQDRVCRGGAFSYAASLARAAMRMRSPQDVRLPAYGLRLVRELRP